MSLHYGGRGPGHTSRLTTSGSSSLPLSDTPTSWSATRINTATANYIRTSPFAYVEYDTTATSITLNSYNDIYASFPEFTELGLYVDGVYQKVSPGAAGAQANVIALAAGTKRLRIVNGLQTHPLGSLIGTFLVSIEANAGLSRVAAAPTVDIVVYTDSIGNGGNATSPTGEAFPMLIRQASSATLGVEGHGYHSLYEDCVDATARAAFVAKVVTWNPSILIMTIGVNDYGGGGLWSAADFGTAYAATLVDLHTALPDLVIYAQSPIAKDVETANGFGDTLADYRTAISNAAAGKAWAIYVDGTTVLDTYGLADGLHPSTDGHFGYGEYWRYKLGYSTPPTSAVIANRSGTTVGSLDMFGLYPVTKTGGSNGAWDASADSTGFAGDFTIRGRGPELTSNLMMAANSDPATDSGFAGLDYAFFKAGSALKIYESGAEISTPIASFFTFVVPLWIGRRGTTLTYRIGYNWDTATILRTVNGVSATLYPDSSIRDSSNVLYAAAY